mgnify:FL=1
MARRHGCRVKRFLAMQISNDIFFAEVERLLGEGGEVTITIRGNSMQPMLRDSRDKVVLRRYEGDELQRGDVMLFRYRGGYVLHRVVSIDGERIVFAGDGNYKLYEQATTKDIVARMVAYVKDGRRVECTQKEWLRYSRVWMALPQLLRRVILGVKRRIKI